MEDLILKAQKNMGSSQKSMYFSTKRTQPFFVTFVQAIIAFKRTLKRMKSRLGFSSTHSKLSNKKGLLRMEIAKSDSTIGNAKFGAVVIHHYDVVPKVMVTSMPTERDDITFENQNEKKPQSLRNIDAGTLFVTVAKHVDKFHREVVASTKATVAERLKRKLRIFDGPTETTLEYSSSAIHDSTHNNSAKASNNLLSGFGPQLANVTAVKDYHEYVTGTTIYFGASVSLQAMHGGFLSFNNTTEIKASAHKILPQTKFVIVNSADLTDFGAVRYGDAIWLQAGQHEVLGANYVSKAAEASDDGAGRTSAAGTAKKKFRPALINCRHTNIFKAQQYGRWIILHKDNPTETIGELVLHMDKVILEQEWFYLASSTPYDSEMYRIGDFDSTKGGNANMFCPSDHCTWKMHLVGLPGDESEEEKARQQLLIAAKDNLKASADLRFQKRDNLIKPLRDMLSPHLEDKAFLEQHAPHKKNLHADQQYLSTRYSKLAAIGFSNNETNMGLLAAIYGKESKIYAFKKTVVRLRDYHLGIKRPELSYKVPEELSELEIQREKYWTLAQNVLITTEAWCQLSANMEQYYRIDFEKKLKAAVAIQQAFRKYMAKKFSYVKVFNDVDQKIVKGLEEKAAHVMRLAREHEMAISQLRSQVKHAPSSRQAVTTQSSIRELVPTRRRDTLSLVTATARRSSVTLPRPGHMSPGKLALETGNSNVPVSPSASSTFITAAPPQTHQPTPRSPLRSPGHRRHGVESDDRSASDMTLNIIDSASPKAIGYLPGSRVKWSAAWRGGMPRAESAPLLGEGFWDNREVASANTAPTLQHISKPPLPTHNSIFATPAKEAPSPSNQLSGTEQQVGGIDLSKSSKKKQVFFDPSEYIPEVDDFEDSIDKQGKPGRRGSGSGSSSARSQCRAELDSKPVRPSSASSSLPSDNAKLRGLPKDVLEDPIGEVTLRRGVKFLRVAASNPDLFDGVQVRRSGRIPPSGSSRKKADRRTGLWK